MTTFYIITIFPEIIESYINSGVLGKALKKEIFKVEICNLRDYATDKHKTVDDAAYGGRAGMIMKCEPIFRAVRDIKSKTSKKSHTILLDPKGKLLTQRYVEELKNYSDVILICGHYGGVDQRVKDYLVDELVSIGDYILTGGEIPALIILDATARLIKGVVGCKGSLVEDSFADNLLSAPQYTRPADFEGFKVPEILLSGDHKKVEFWNKEKRKEETNKFRPELLKTNN